MKIFANLLFVKTKWNTIELWSLQKHVNHHIPQSKLCYSFPELQEELRILHPLFFLENRNEFS